MTLSAPAAPQPPAEHHYSLVDVTGSAQAWGADLVTKSDRASRTPLSQSCRELRQLVFQAAQQATVTLVAYSGLSGAVWQRRLALALEGLVTRGPRQDTKVVLSIPAPHSRPAKHPQSPSSSRSARHSAGGTAVRVPWRA